MTQVCQRVERATEVCVICPEVPYIAPVAAVTLTDPNYGWNASAYSAQRRVGDIYTEFTLPDVLGTVVGLAPERRSHAPRDVPHGLYAYRQGGARWWVVVEAGVPVTTPVLRNAALDDVFRIERRAGVVRYFHDGRQVHASSVPSIGSAVVVACLYAADDGVD
jgi:hypothetical protein